MRAFNMKRINIHVTLRKKTKKNAKKKKEEKKGETLQTADKLHNVERVM